MANALNDNVTISPLDQNSPQLNILPSFNSLNITNNSSQVNLSEGLRIIIMPMNNSDHTYLIILL
ncbi:hypothetical protein C1645_841078 [Glomus cerebriforme]|uniref:Uncharacterized protein n=1 Tax=Glomus cerebriforme TaxID=658196 RepID=A0A397RYL9_9GLOM|nr:hypothetical protein C1645_841078 [Glomus cerebriforme]